MQHRAVPVLVANSDISGDHSSWQPLPRQWVLSDFRPIKKLYKGYASKVYLAEDHGKIRKCSPDNVVVSLPRENAYAVLKVYDLARLSPLTRYQLDREIRLHRSIQHPNIVTLHAAFEQVRQGNYI